MFCKDVSVTNTYTLTDYVGTGTADDLPREVGVFSKATKERKREILFIGVGGLPLLHRWKLSTWATVPFHASATGECTTRYSKLPQNYRAHIVLNRIRLPLRRKTWRPSRNPVERVAPKYHSRFHSIPNLYYGSTRGRAKLQRVEGCFGQLQRFFLLRRLCCRFWSEFNHRI